MKMALRPRLRTLPPTREDGDDGDGGGGGESSSDDGSVIRNKKSSKRKEKGGGMRKQTKQPKNYKRSLLPSSSSILPTIYAENRDSFADTNGNLSSNNNNTHSDNSEDEDDDNRKMPANKTLTSTATDDDKEQQRRRSQIQDEFVPAQLQPKGNGKKKKSSSNSNSVKGGSKTDGGRTGKKSSSTKTSSTVTDTSWDELGDEIASALHQSLMVDDGRLNIHDSYAPVTKKSSSSKQKTSSNTTTTTNNNDDNHDNTNAAAALPPWKCPACTYKNEPLHLVCSVCGTAAITASIHHNNTPPPLNSSLNKSGGSSSNSARSVGVNNNVMGSSALFHDSNLSQQQQQQQYNPHHQYHGSTESLSNYDYLRRSSFERSVITTSDSFLNNNNNSLRASSFHPTTNNNIPIIGDPHIGHRRMMGRRQSDEMSNDSYEGGGGPLRSSFNNEHRRSSRESYQERRRPSIEEYYRARRSTIEGRDRDSGGGGGGSRHHRTRSRRGGGDIYDDNDSLSRRSRNSRDDYHPHHRSSSSKDYRKSTMMDMEYGYERDRGGGGSSSVGRYRGSRSSDEGRNRDDYSEASESLGTKGRITGGKYYDDGSIISEMSDDEATFAERTVRTMQTIKKMVIPSGEVTIIYTDVQGSTALWEADPMSMKKATDIHDSIIRRCYSDHGGYEISTEGDAFNLAFQHPADAIGFALKAQLALYRAKWPEGTLNHPDGCDNEKKKFRGFRVRFGMHHGPTTSTVHKTTGRTTYQGEAVEIAKAIEKMSHGGQILTTVETWRTVSGMAEQLLGSPQVMDCGEHLLWDPKKSDLAKKKASSKKVLSKRIVQLVPNSLSYDFFAARGGQEVKEGEAPQKVCGRVFPPLLSHGQLSTSFLNAPYIGNKVAMVFVYTDKMEALEEKERKKNYKILAKYVRSHLMRLSPPGYECQEDKGSWMLAFDRIDNGINFGLDLKENVMKNAKLLGDVDKSQVFRVGIHWGPFLSMGPHTVTGHADYFGPIVNRAARVAAQCEPGQVCVGVPMGTDEEPPDPGPTVEVDVLGVKQLKGISIEMAIFGCRKVDKKPDES